MFDLSFTEISGLLAIASSIIATVVKSFKYVHEGELGIKLRFGKAVRNKKQMSL